MMAVGTAFDSLPELIGFRLHREMDIEIDDEGGEHQISIMVVPHLYLAIGPDQREKILDYPDRRDHPAVQVIHDRLQSLFMSAMRHCDEDVMCREFRIEDPEVIAVSARARALAAKKSLGAVAEKALKARNAK